jgi:hypothetical protein
VRYVVACAALLACGTHAQPQQSPDALDAAIPDALAPDAPISDPMLQGAQTYIKASNTDAADRFGWAVSLSADGQTLAVGAPFEDSNATGIDGNQLDN